MLALVLRCWLLPVLAVAAAAAGSNSTPSSQASLQSCSPQYLDAAVQHLSEIIQFKTVSDAEAGHHVVDVHEFHNLGAWLADTYADVWQHFTVEQVIVNFPKMAQLQVWVSPELSSKLGQPATTAVSTPLTIRCPHDS
jgi:hypothetical protein